MPSYVRTSQSELEFPDEKKDVILLAGSNAKLADCFIDALENEFPNCDVVYCKDLQNIEQLRLSTIKLVNLVIIHHGLNDVSISQVDRLKTIFAPRPVALAYDNTELSNQYVRQYGNHFDSHLPMDVKLDVWLSIIRLILSGGNYMCPELLKEQYKQTETPCHIEPDNDVGRTIQHSNGAGLKLSIKSGSKLCKLTERETEVIKLMAAGQQNKLIAASLDLSEHTVKLHIHHIISKLDVSNRTEAAAMFLNSGRTGEEHC